MVVVVIIGVLVAIAIPIYGTVTQGAEMGAHEANVRTIQGAAQMYIAQQGSPTTVNLSEEDVDSDSELAPFLDNPDELYIPWTDDTNYKIEIDDGEIIVTPGMDADHGDTPNG